MIKGKSRPVWVALFYCLFFIVIVGVLMSSHTHVIHEGHNVARAAWCKGYTLRCTSNSIGSGSPQRLFPEAFFFRL